MYGYTQDKDKYLNRLRRIEGQVRGLQNGLVFVLGGAAIGAGLGSLAYRRKFTRRR